MIGFGHSYPPKMRKFLGGKKVTRCQLYESVLDIKAVCEISHQSAPTRYFPLPEKVQSQRPYCYKLHRRMGHGQRKNPLHYFSILTYANICWSCLGALIEVWNHNYHLNNVKSWHWFSVTQWVFEVSDVNSHIIQHTHRSSPQFTSVRGSEQTSDGYGRHFQQMTDSCSTLITHHPSQSCHWFASDFQPETHGFCSVKFSYY